VKLWDPDGTPHPHLRLAGVAIQFLMLIVLIVASVKDWPVGVVFAAGFVIATIGFAGLKLWPSQPRPPRKKPPA
jgi:hypothetical protein